MCQQLVNKSFCSADISALYTNVSIEACIDDVIQLANDNRNYLQLLGLKLIDVHKILDLVLCNAYFTYSQKLFLQVQGIFMGCKVSPLLAIARVYSFEKRVLFADAHYINIPYGRYVDDAYTLASSRKHAEMLFNRIAAQDPDSKLSWKIEFPDEDSASTFIPFLGTQIKVSGDAIMSKFYRKPQKKNIVLHARSHHCLKTKVEIAKNFYYTAEHSSTSPEFVEESLQVVDNLLRCNGYKNPRDLRTSKQGVSSGYDKNKEQNMVYLKLPYISEAISSQVVKFVKKHKLPVKVIFTPGRKLRDVFCSSRPYDKQTCRRKNCVVCDNLEKGKCTIQTPVYLVTCLICEEKYVGETGRSAYDRLSEHLRYARNPTSRSYTEEAFAIHYRENHVNSTPQLRFQILDSDDNIIRRKILESYHIYTIKPTINNKDECTQIKRFLV